VFEFVPPPSIGDVHMATSRTTSDDGAVKCSGLLAREWRLCLCRGF